MVYICICIQWVVEIEAERWVSSLQSETLPFLLLCNIIMHTHQSTYMAQSGGPTYKFNIQLPFYTNHHLKTLITIQILYLQLINL